VTKAISIKAVNLSAQPPLKLYLLVLLKTSSSIHSSSYPTFDSSYMLERNHSGYRRDFKGNAFS